MTTYIHSVRYPVVLILIAFFAHESLVAGTDAATPIGFLIFGLRVLIFALRVLALTWSGWLMAQGHHPLRAAATSGVALHVLDLLVLPAALFVVRGGSPALLYALLYTVVSAPLAAGLAGLGAYAHLRRRADLRAA